VCKFLVLRKGIHLGLLKFASPHTSVSTIQPGWPNVYDEAIGWDVNNVDNMCKWCPEEGGNNCGQHKQSPIDLHRDRAIAGNANEKECPDWHW
jgi:hypothetical protein